MLRHTNLVYFTRYIFYNIIVELLQTTKSDSNYIFQFDKLRDLTSIYIDIYIYNNNSILRKSLLPYKTNNNKFICLKQKSTEVYNVSVH